MNISPDPGCYWATDPDVVHGSRPGQDNIMALYKFEGHIQISMALVAAWSLDTIMAAGCGIDPEYPYDL